MKLILPTILFALFSIGLSFSALSNSDSTKTILISDDGSTDEVTGTDGMLKLDFKPTLGLGFGTFTFYGDVLSNHQKSHFAVSRFATELRISNPLNSWLDIQFHTIFGKVSANERSLTNPARNLNFESRIRAGGVGLTYNFDHILKPRPKRYVEPYLYLGIESFEFLSKTDLFDAHGNKYHYWSDGSIMNMAENDPNASQAIRIYRDYTYETDLREQNLDDLGKYPERSWATPIGIGLNMHLNKNLKFRMGTTLHLTFTDLVDNTTALSGDGRAGNKGNDKLLFTNFSLSYDLQPIKKENEEEELKEPWEEELYALDTVDTDMDGVVDFQDICPYTPEGCIPVDERGCKDDDNDGVPDCIDEELNSIGPFIKDNGVAYTEEELINIYRRYKDSTGEFSEVEETDRSIVYAKGGGKGGADGKVDLTSSKNKEYVIILDKKQINVSANELYKYLGYKEFETVQSGDTLFYVLSGLGDLADVAKIQDNLKDKGIDSNIGKVDFNNKGEKVINKTSQEDIEDAKKNGGSFGIPEITESGDVTYRVQIAALSKVVNERAFLGIPDLVQFKGSDGLTRYYSGSFTDLSEASKHKIIMAYEEGWDNAFVVVFKDGKRISLKEVTEVNPEYKENILEYEKNLSGDVQYKYSVQVMESSEDLSNEELQKLLALGNVTPVKTDGKIKYMIGPFDSKEEAETAMEEFKTKGIENPQIIVEYGGQLLSIEELKKILGVE